MELFISGNEFNVAIIPVLQAISREKAHQIETFTVDHKVDLSFSLCSNDINTLKHSITRDLPTKLTVTGQLVKSGNYGILSFTPTQGGEYYVSVTTPVFDCLYWRKIFIQGDHELSCALRWGMRGEEKGVLSPCLLPCPMEILGKITISTISSGFAHTVLLTDVGTAYGYGDNSKYQLGLEQMNYIESPTEIPFFKKLNGLEVSCGRFSTSLLIEGGDVYSFGDYNEREQKSPKIVHMESLKRHRVNKLTYAFGMHLGLSSSGSVFFWKAHADTPTHDDFLRDFIIVQISGSFKSLVVLNSQGDVYEGTYDHYKKCAKWVKKWDHKEEQFPIVQISAKGEARLMLNSAGKVFSWGELKVRSMSLALGRPNCNNPEVPAQISTPSTVLFTQIASGTNHCAALTAEGELYTWGDCFQGQLGHGSTEATEVPTRVQAIKQRVYSILVTGNESIAVIAPPQSRLGESLQEILREERFTDVILKSREGNQVKAHKVILQARCSALGRFIDENVDSNGIVQLEYGDQSIKTLLQFLYADRIQLVDDDKEIESMAEKFNLNEMKLETNAINRSSLLKDTLRLVVNQEEYSDFKIILRYDEAESKTIFAHRCLLSRSEYFKRVIDSGMKESQERTIVINNLEEETLLKLLEWTYTDSTGDISVDMALDLMQAADEYAAGERLKDLCTSMIIKEMDLEVVCYVLEIAKFSNASKLKSACMELICSNLNQVKQTETYQNLSMETKEEIAKY
eukprot:TRINITY_DN5454_c0_g1_i1.p1 TRINITY_DN5454_c0_g1~~TRINITY_DN5454_c0_g1_i1.p1  ORF type:complete len:741 (-),score=267.59 TRINITY_DN5454_c0_g1_i1:243-2465(-)